MMKIILSSSNKRVICALVIALFCLCLLPVSAHAEPGVLHAGALAGDALYREGGDQQSEMISMQSVVLGNSGLEIEFTEYKTMQEGFEALQRGEIDTLYPMTPFARDLAPLGLVASDTVYDISWDIIFVGDYSEDKLNRIAVPGGRLAPYYCREFFPNSELILCSSRLDCLDAVIEGRADSAVFNGFQTENIIQNGSKYSKLTYTVLPSSCPAVFVLRASDEEHLALVNDCLAKTEEREKVDYMVLSRAVSVEEASRNATIAKYRPIFIAALALVAVAAVTFLIIMTRILLPLEAFDRHMRKNEKLPIKGNARLKKLATTFNQLYEDNFEKQRLLTNEAEHDGLTGLLNRRSFDKLLQMYEDKNYILVIADADHFKEINDKYGHAVGDEILKKVARILERTFRKDDLICRIGGDEFAVIAVDPHPSFAEVLALKIEEINAALKKPTDGLPATALSSGAALSGEGQSKEDVYRKADNALYEVKSNGRGGFRLAKG